DVGIANLERSRGRLPLLHLSACGAHPPQSARHRLRSIAAVLEYIRDGDHLSCLTDRKRHERKMAGHSVPTLEGYVRHSAFVDTDRRQISHPLHALDKSRMARDPLCYVARADDVADECR